MTAASAAEECELAEVGVAAGYVPQPHFKLINFIKGRFNWNVNFECFKPAVATI